MNNACHSLNAQSLILIAGMLLMASSVNTLVLGPGGYRFNDFEKVAFRYNFWP